MIKVPAPKGKTFLPYQLAFIQYAFAGKGTLLADEMGLGKTIQAIGLINAINPERVLIVCPAGLVSNWYNELREWRTGRSDVFVVSYHGAEKQIDNPYYDLLVIDEAHYIKNPNAKRSIIIKKLAKNAARVLLLTGTPIENRPIELWPLLQLVAPEEFDPPTSKASYVIGPEQRKSHPGEGPNFWNFAKRYCGLKKNYFYGKSGRRSGAWDFSGATNLIELNMRLRRTCMCRRLKKDVLSELPPKRRSIIELSGLPKIDQSSLLSNLNEDNYAEMVRRLSADRITFETYAKQRHLQALAKVDACLTILHDMLDSVQKIVVFAHHHDVIQKLYQDLGAQLDDGEFAVQVTGKTHVSDRGAAVKSFQENPMCRIFIGSIGAAGVGITLTAASNVVFVELDPVPGRMTQAEDRCHRIGQKDSVNVYHLIYDGTLCARMAKILVKKQDVINEVLDVGHVLDVEHKTMPEM